MDRDSVIHTAECGPIQGPDPGRGRRVHIARAGLAVGNLIPTRSSGLLLLPPPPVGGRSTPLQAWSGVEEPRVPVRGGWSAAPSHSIHGREVRPREVERCGLLVRHFSSD